MLLVAIAALVIDIGFVFWIERQEQDAADPAAIAAARFIPTDDEPMMQQAACYYARQNGFFDQATTNTGCTPANDRHASVLDVHYPPSASAGTFAGRPGFVEVVISRPHETFFARVLGMPTIGVASSAVAAFSDGDSNSSSLVALDTGGCGGTSAGLVTGGGTVSIEPISGVNGGHVHVNNSCSPAHISDDLCNNNNGALQVSGGATLTTQGSIYVTGSCQQSTGGGSPSTISYNSLDEGAPPIGDPLADLPSPSFGPPGAYCGIPGAAGVPQTTENGSEGCDFKTNQTYDLTPGIYYGGWKITGKNVTIRLDPGIYIIAGGGINLIGEGEITSVEGDPGIPAPVMIFSTDNPKYSTVCQAGTGAASQCQDKLNFSAKSTLRLRGLTDGPYRGILMWQDGRGSAPTLSPKLDITLSGQTSLNIAGTIYDPRGLVTVGGDAAGTSIDGTAAIQIISWRWKIAGGGLLRMPYDPNTIYQFDQKGLVR